MTWKTWLVLAAILGCAAFLFGRASKPDGISPAAAAQLARRAGDSAVASYSKPIAQVIGSLQESVTFYRGKAQAGAKIVVGHQAVTIHDQAPVQTSANPGSVTRLDTAQVVLPAIDSGGIQLAESLTVSPAPNLVLRALHVTVDPDTILVALLKTPEGLQRFTAAGTAAGLRVSVADAAAVAPASGRSLGHVLRTVLVLSSCVVTGVEAADPHRSAVVLIGGAAGCGVGGALTF